jgi:competence protein ComEC
LVTIQILLLALSAWGGQVTVDMLDVGQGDAILIRTEGFTALIDAGPRDANTVQQLRALGVQSLDLVFATHPHADHIGRMPQILLEFDVGIYIDNGMTHTTKNYERLMAAVERMTLVVMRTRRA